MWLPRENRWTLIDFGCAVRVGEAAPLAATLKYSPPEVVWALQQGVRTVTAAASMDAWALGIIAVELLSRRNVLAMMEGREIVRRPLMFFCHPNPAHVPVLARLEADFYDDLCHVHILRALPQLRARILCVIKPHASGVATDEGPDDMFPR